MPVGGWALGLGQGLRGAGDAVDFFARQKQEALQNALRQRQLDLEQQRMQAQEAAQTTAQMPGGVNITPEVYNKFFANTPSAARFQHQPDQTMTEGAQASPQNATYIPGLGVAAMDDQGINVGHPEQYQSTEPFNQWKALYQGGQQMARVQTQQAGADARSARTNATRTKIAEGMRQVQTARTEAMTALGNARNAIAAQRAARDLSKAMIAEQALRLHAVQVEAAAHTNAYRAQTTPGAVNAQMLNSLGIGDIDLPDNYDPDQADKQIEEILKGLPALPGGTKGAPGQSPTLAPAPPPARGAAAPSGRITSIEPADKSPNR